jgi:hypothetical protein
MTPTIPCTPARQFIWQQLALSTLGPAHTSQAVAPGANFFEFKE